MGRNRLSLIIGAVWIIALAGCQPAATTEPTRPARPTQAAPTQIPPAPSPELLPTLTAEIFPSATAQTVFASKAEFAESEFNALKSDLFDDSTTACVFHPSSYDLSCLGRDGWRIYQVNAPTLIARCPDGRIYLGRYNTLYLQQNGTISEVVDYEFYSGADFLACGQDDEFWLNRGDSLSHFDGLTWKNYWATDYLGFAGYELNKEIAVAQNGSLWLTTRESIATFDGSDWQIFEADKSYKDNPIPPRGLVADADGNVWVITLGDLKKYDGTQWTNYPAPDDFYSNAVTLDHENQLWIAGSGSTLDPENGSSIYLFDPQTESWSLKFNKDAFRALRIENLQFDDQDRLWVATNYGLFVHDGSIWTAYHTFTAELLKNQTASVIIFGDGPRLAALAPKEPGSVRGKFVNPESPDYENLQVEICVELVAFIKADAKTPCENQAFHALTTMDADGNFLFTGIPVGLYYLVLQTSATTWAEMIYDPPYPESSFGTTFVVYPGTETQLGTVMREKAPE